MMYGVFAKRTGPPSSSLLFWLLASSFLTSPATFPDPHWPPIARSVTFITLQVLFGSPTTWSKKKKIGELGSPKDRFFSQLLRCA
jgi:hypothetical protein